MQNNNKIIFWIAFVGVILVIGLSTIILVISDHHEKLRNVFESKLIESTEKCYHEDVCKEDEVTLKYLIEKGYLEKEDTVDPITKEYLDEDTKITNKDGHFTIARKSK